MASFNRVILAGNLTRDPELRHLPSGTPVVNFRIAVNEPVRDRQSNQWRENVCYVDIVAWERQAETCNQYLSKGSPVLLEGRLVYEEWKNQQGESRSRLSVRASRVQFLSSGQAVKRNPEDASDAESAEAGDFSDDFPSDGQGEDIASGQDDENLPF